MSRRELATLPARRGKAVRLKRGQHIEVVNTHGTQVVDFWAFNAGDLTERLSMEHSRNAWYRLAPVPGDVLVTSLRRPVLTLVEDTSPGVHDTLIPCCDARRYEQLGCEGYHDSCADNMAAGLKELGYTPPPPPSPLNLFMNVALGANGRLVIAPPEAKPGDHVVFRAEMDCVVALSACPHDILPVNGADCRPKDVQFAVYESDRDEL